MLNPVFHTDTVFLDQAPDGGLAHKTGAANGALEGGITINRLDEKQPLFRIETESGAHLTLSPETVFALHRTPDGRLVRYLPIDAAYAANPPLLDWHAPVEGIDKSDIRRFAIVGMLVGGGTHSTERGRASNIILPTGSLAQDVLHFLQQIAADEGHGSFGRTRSPTFRMVSEGDASFYFIKSRSLTHAASRLIEPKTQELLFDPLALGRSDLWAFAYGLAGVLRVDDGGNASITHRSVTTLRAIANMLELRFGIAGYLREVPYERAVMSSRTGHRLEFDAAAQSRMAALRLRPDWGGTGTIAPFRAEKIVKVDTITQRSAAAIVAGRRDQYPYPLTANSFVFDSEFHVNGAVTDLAAHPTILTDPGDPISIMETAPEKRKAHA